MDEFVGQNYEIQPISTTVLVRHTATDTPNKDSSSKKGCKGSATAPISSSILLAGASLIIKKKKK